MNRRLQFDIIGCGVISAFAKEAFSLVPALP